MTEEALAVVGDVHGDDARLERALAYLENAKRHRVFVGDYINRGPNSKRVLDLLCDLVARDPDNVTLLRGNHEEGLVRFLESGDLGLFLRSGGLGTVGSYYPAPPPDVISRFAREFPPSHRRLLRRMVGWYETAAVLVSHTGYDIARPHLRDDEVMTTSSHPGLLVPGASTLPKLVVFGHYVQQSRTPLDLGSVVCLDTGSGTFVDGRLSVLLLPEREFVQF
ncbi:MAG TPA: metallophosphoesterase [Micromonosporaceae bacterium]|nr:metallophosphoesterase [Micromonosporaceae bacterium]